MLFRFCLIIIATLFVASCATTPARIQIEWTTATELNTAGFNVYRGDNAGGPFTKINQQMIPASTDALVGSKYRFEDVSAGHGNAYYYMLEDVELNGTSTRHGPIAMKATGSPNVSELLSMGVGVLAFSTAGWLAARFIMRKARNLAGGAILES